MIKQITTRLLAPHTPTEHERLAAELADYTTDADRNDLNALLDDYSDNDAAEVRDLLNRALVPA